MTFRTLAALTILVCAAGGAAFLPSLMWLFGVILPSDDRVSVTDIPALAGMGVIYGLVIGILRAYRHKMEQNRIARVFSAIGFVLGGVYGFIFGITIDYSPVINTGGMVFFMGIPIVLFTWRSGK